MGGTISTGRVIAEDDESKICEDCGSSPPVPHLKNQSYQDFIDFEFDHYVDEMYRFHCSEEYRAALELPSIQKKFLAWAWAKFQAERKAILDLRWAVIHQDRSGNQLSKDAAEIKAICSEVDEVIGGKA